MSTFAEELFKDTDWIYQTHWFQSAFKKTQAETTDFIKYYWIISVENKSEFINSEADLLFAKIRKAVECDENDQYVDYVENTESFSLNNWKEKFLKVRPKFIILLGGQVLKNFLPNERSLSECHGQLIIDEINQASNSYQARYYPLFHPQYLLINPSQKAVVWKELQKLMKME